MNRNFLSRSRINSCGLVAAICLGLSAVNIAAFSPQAIAQQQQQTRTLSVTGQGRVSIPTSKSVVRLGIQAEGKTAVEVQQEVARRSSAVVELLRSRKVEKLETTGISLNPVYNYQNNRQLLTGYTATNTVSFRLDTAETGKLLDDAVKAGASRIDGVSFVATDEAIERARQQALQQATRDAGKQADAVLSALNLTRRGVVSISINSASAPMPQRLMRSASLQAESATTPVIGGEQEVRASVTLEISY
ncbi:MAG: SIMPL domain-containing protein [Cyanobacteriota bacterium]|nr:SIMPL domain-containing protein [Cyanobacteriota bacterium]